MVDFLAAEVERGHLVLHDQGTGEPQPERVRTVLEGILEGNLKDLATKGLFLHQ
jgi:hypothetical protein